MYEQISLSPFNSAKDFGTDIICTLKGKYFHRVFYMLSQVLLFPSGSYNI